MMSQSVKCLKDYNAMQSRENALNLVQRAWETSVLLPEPYVENVDEIIMSTEPFLGQGKDTNIKELQPFIITKDKKRKYSAADISYHALKT
jgi:hypothetical protein